MKNILFFRLFSFLILALAGTSCSKKDTFEQKQTVLNSENSVRPAPAANDLAEWSGSIAGTTDPARTKAIITVSNGSFISAEHIADVRTGQFRINNLAEGVYSLLIKFAFPGDLNYRYLTIPKIRVSQGQVTDLGIISLK
jgi:hypothetical protein